MKIVNDCGALYRLSERRYKKYLMDGLTGSADGPGPSVKEYGTYIGSIDFHSLDARREDYREAYETTYERAAIKAATGGET